MSVSHHPDNLRFRLESGTSVSDLSSDYDEQADILYLWLGDKPREAFSLSSREGHLVRIDPRTNEIVGFTIFDFHRIWQDDDVTELNVTPPDFRHDQDSEVTHSEPMRLVPA